MLAPTQKTADHSQQKKPVAVQPNSLEVVSRDSYAKSPGSAQTFNKPVAVDGLPRSLRGRAPIILHPGYDYTPTVMLDHTPQGKVYRLWWSGNVQGDYILYAEASSLLGPWRSHDGKTAFDIALQPTNNYTSDGFDAQRACSPSVVYARGKYYLYYSGLGYQRPYDFAMVGVAESSDGLTWHRLHDGNPIVEPFSTVNRPHRYGAGKPAVFFANDMFYLAYTDSTSSASNPITGNGIYCLRSPDPCFQRSVATLSSQGFVWRTKENATQYAIADACSVDWSCITSHELMVMAATAPQGNGATLRFWDLGGHPVANELKVSSPTEKRLQGKPGIVRAPDGGALTTNAGHVGFDVLQTSLKDDATASTTIWDLATYGADLHIHWNNRAYVAGTEGSSC